MIKGQMAYLMACIFLTQSMVCLASQAAKDDSGQLLRYFHAEEKPWLKPSSEEVRFAKKTLASTPAPAVCKTAAAFCLAMANIEREQNVMRMVSYAQRSWPAETEAEDGLTTLASALYRLLDRYRSQKAAHYIVSLNLDGGPGDVLSDVRVDAFRLDPNAIADAWSKLSAKQQMYLVHDFGAVSSDDEGFSHFLTKFKKSRSNSIRRLVMLSIRSSIHETKRWKSNGVLN